MHAREGCVSLSRLWPDFEKRFLTLCQRHALEFMESEPHRSDVVFGTALDLCEDVFLRTFDNSHLSLVSIQGEILQVEPVLANSGARLLLKTTAFESSHISMLPDEAGLDGKWLRQMGSTAFSAAEIGWLCPDKKGRSAGEELEKILFAKAYHTLPILFERPSFVIPQERPPWSNDLLEDSYIRNIWRATRGSSICLSDGSVEKWKKALTKRSVVQALNGLLLDIPIEAVSEKQLSRGRPDRQSDAFRDYQRTFPKGRDCTLKMALQQIELVTGNLYSESTMRRALRPAEKD